MAQNDDLDTPFVVVVGFVGALAVFVAIVMLQALYMNMSEAVVRRQEGTEPLLTVAEYRTQQEAVLHSYRWIDEKKGIVGMPIDRAEELVLRSFASPGALQQRDN